MTTAKTSSTSKTATSATKSVEDTIAATKAQMDDAVRAGQETAVKTFEQAVATSKEQFEKAGAQFFEGFNEVADFQKANVDAVMAASTAWAKGFETMGRAWFGFTQSTLEQTVSTAKAMMTAKTLKEVVEQFGFVSQAGVGADPVFSLNFGSDTVRFTGLNVDGLTPGGLADSLVLFGDL